MRAMSFSTAATYIRPGHPETMKRRDVVGARHARDELFDMETGRGA